MPVNNTYHIPSSLLHPLSSSTLINLLKQLWVYGYEGKYFFRVLFILIMCISRQPFLYLESRRFKNKINNQTLTSKPIFIIGHWRSGTTYLQNLLGRDPQFGVVSLLQASMPHEFLTLPSMGKKIISHILPSKRFMDNVELSLDMPWEEEMAMANYCQYSFYNVSFFPQYIESIFRKAIFFDGNKPENIETWKYHYLNFLKKVQFTQPGKILLLKNPANTARIDLIRQILPGSRFIFIHRHPYEVFASTMHLYTKAHANWGLQTVDRDRLMRHVLVSYRELMDAYSKQSAGLEKKDLVEISYKDLEKDPMASLNSIYQRLQLEHFKEAEPHFIQYLRQQRNYIKNNLVVNELEKAVINKNWHDTFTRYAYEM